MKVFISWSGNQSRAVAEALSNWLKRVIQAVEPFFTPNMEKGVKWSNEIDDALEGTRFGIVCLTPDNLNSNWIHYETGALSKTKDAVIWTFLHGLSAGDVPQPLGKFQHTLSEKADVLKLLHSINARLREVGTGALTDSLLEEIFEESWLKLETKLNEAKKLSDETVLVADKKPSRKRDEKDILNEILEVVRDQQRQMNSFEERLTNISYESKNPLLSSIKHIRSKNHRTTIIDKSNGIIFNILIGQSFVKVNETIRTFIDFTESKGFYCEYEIKSDHCLVKILQSYILNDDLVDEVTREAISIFGNNLSSWEYVYDQKIL